MQRQSLAFLITVLSSLVAGSLFAQQPLKPPPIAVEATASVERGDSTRITLRATGRRPGKINFLIRSNPQHGRLGSIHQLSDDQAVVTYFHEPGAAGSSDGFRYAVQSVDSPVSASAPVQIRIVEPPPRLSLPKRLDFGRIPQGSAALAELRISNTGGPGEFKLRLEGPFTLEGPDTFIVGAGASVVTSIRVDTLTPGPRNGRVVVVGSTLDPCFLTAEVYRPFQITPAQPTLFPAGGIGEMATVRDAEIFVRNVSDEFLEILWAPNKVLIVPESVTLAPGEEKRIRVGALADKAEGFEAELEGQASGSPFKIPVIVKPLPAELSITSPLPLRLRSTSGVPTGQITVTNSGGDTARLGLTAPEGFTVSPPAESTALPPASQVTFTVRDESGAERRGQQVITMRSGNQSFEIPLLIEQEASQPEAVTPSVQATRTPTSSQPRPRPGASQQKDGSLPRTVPQPSPYSTDHFIPPDLVQLEQGENRVTLAWKSEEWPGSNVDFEWSRIESDQDGLPKVVWYPWPAVAVSDQDGTASAVLYRLPAGSSWRMRLVRIEPDGSRAPMDGALIIRTSPRQNWGWSAYLLLVILVGAVGYGIWHLIKRFGKNKGA